MKCPGCGHDNSEGAKFCNACGARLEAPCARCGQPNPAGSLFCSECGTSLATAAAPTPTVRFASPQGYTPTHLAEKILTTRSALEGERKQVTVLFADLTGSTALIADRDPEEARKLLDPVLEIMMESVHRYEGIVNQVMGDGIMAIFGAPLAHEDHAVRACYAALSMQSAIRRHSDELRRSHGVTMQMRIGLNSGDVLVGAIGTDLRMDYAAVGQTTHLAARMEQVATPGSILLTAETLRLAEGFVQVTPLGPLPVKGIAEPVEAFELSGAVPVRTRLQAATARGLTRFVGRQSELEVLGQALKRAAAGHGQLVALVGEPGVGKSRLFWEFTHSHRTRGWLILQSGSVSYGKATTYLPIIDLLKAYFQIEQHDDGRKIREKVTGKLLTLDKALEPTLPALFALLDASVDDAQWQALDSLQRRQRTLDAVKRLLLRESQVQPLIVVLEDLHWIDSETQAVLDSVVESLATSRVLLLVNYRPEYEHGWGTKTSYTQLRVDSLPSESAEELLRDLLGDDPEHQPLRQLLIKGTEGNPFFLEESVRTLVETQALVGGRGAYRLTKPLPSIRVPATVQAVLAARIDRLPAEEKRLLQTAAVIGKDVLYSVVKATAELSDENLRTALAHLQDAEFLYESSLFPDLEYTFKHALTHEVAYGSIVQDRRRTLHARIVDAIEALYADRLDDQIERLAHHAFRAERWEKAVVYLHQAGTRALDRSANAEAGVLLEQALVALSQLPDSGARIEQAIDLRLDLRTAVYPLGRLDRCFDLLREAETLAQTLGDQRRLSRILVFLADNFCMTGDPHRAIETAHRSLSIAATPEDHAIGAYIERSLGWAYLTMGDHRRAAEIFRKSIAGVETPVARDRSSPQVAALIGSRNWLAWCLAELGQFPEGIGLAEETFRISEALDRPFMLLMTSWAIGLVHLRKGDLVRAIPTLERGLELSRAWGFQALSFHGVAAFLGAAYTLAGRLEEALPLLERVVTQTESMGAWFDHLIAILPLTEAHMLAGRLDEAARIGQRALEVSIKHKERGHEAWALRLLGEISARRDSPDIAGAESYYRQAMALADELGMRPLLTHCHLGLGTLYRQMGRRQQAQEHLVTATAMLREMDMGLWLQKAEAEVAAVG